MARPRSFNTDEVVEQLCDYFWKHGYSDTSLDNLAQELQIKRGSLFNAFGSKENLINAAYGRYGQKFKLRFKTIELGVPAIAHYFKNAVKSAITDSAGKGCFLVNLLMSSEFPTPELHQLAEQDMVLLRDFFEKHLNQARLDGQLAAEISISSGIDILLGVTVGIFALARIQGTSTMIQEFADNNLRGLFGISFLSSPES